MVLDLAGLSVPSQSRPIRFGHDPLSGVGHTDAVRVEEGQLVATGLVSRDTPAAREVVVSADSTLCIIEAMKVMNEIKAEREFEVVEVLVRNGDAVEFGQPLFLIR